MKIAVSIAGLLFLGTAVATEPPAIEREVLLTTNESWDGTRYVSYPTETPKLTVLRIKIPAHTVLDWHVHPMPNAAYVVAGELTVEKQATGESKRFVRGQVVPEMVDTYHRGLTDDSPVELIVFYAGAKNWPLSKP